MKTDIILTSNKKKIKEKNIVIQTTHLILL